jgi:hypothetical protein
MEGGVPVSAEAAKGGKSLAKATTTMMADRVLKRNRSWISMSVPHPRVCALPFLPSLPVH